MTDPYLLAEVQTASPERLHMLVVQGAIRFTQEAIDAVKDGDRTAAHLAFTRSRSCIVELLSGLDGSRMPETISGLKALFVFAIGRITQSELRFDANLAEDALMVLESHQKTWEIVTEKLREDGEVLRLDPASNGVTNMEGPHALPVDQRVSTREWLT